MSNKNKSFGVAIVFILLFSIFLVSCSYGKAITQDSFFSAPETFGFKTDDCGFSKEKCYVKKAEKGVNPEIAMVANIDKSKPVSDFKKASFTAIEKNYGIKPKDLTLVRDNCVGNSNLCSVIFKQNYNGLEVFRANGGVWFKDNKLVEIRGNFIPKIQISTKPKLNKKTIIGIVQNDIKKKGIFAKDTSFDKYSLIIYLDKKFKPYLAAKIDLDIMKKKDKNFPVTKPSYFVDANTGKVLEIFENLVSFDLQGEVTGTVYTDNPYDGGSEQPFEDTVVNVNNEEIETDANGRFVVEELEGETTITTSFQDENLRVVNYAQEEASYQTQLDINEDTVNDINWDLHDLSYSWDGEVNEESNVYLMAA